MPRKLRKRPAHEVSKAKPKQSKVVVDTVKAASTATQEKTELKAAPEVYTTIPPQSKKKKKPGQLTAKQLRQYFDEGFLVIPNFFATEELDPVRDGIADEVERIAQMLYDGGKIKDKHEDADLFHRLTLLEKDFPGTSVLLHKSENLPQAFKDLWSHERVLNVMEQLLGPEVGGHPGWNLRCKTPYNEMADVPWHQDNAYFDEGCLHTFLPTVWIPVVDVNEKNGCLQMLRGGHRKGVTGTHTCCAGGTWYVQMSDEEMEKAFDADLSKDVVTCDFKYGGLVLFSNCIPHRSLENHSDIIRWSLDLRYQRPDRPSGLWGVKECVVLRTKKEKNFKINWEDFEKVDRTKAQEQVAHSSQVEAVDDFDTTLTGPWMHRWDVVNHNKHTANIKPSDATTFTHKA
ncbi:phytanoyl-CoA dioxygenase domain-containing protein 1 homolog [Amphiura filiformis]|uniref:phytanoyl-CoA dioxygenase domain-containing protein 1 homolog n=1 Tax=Amphiura filiformis TaxID=82378 RepID=UPI003B226BDE